MKTEYSNILKTQPIHTFDQLYESVLITTAKLDGNHPKIIYANDAFCKVTAYDKSEIIGQTPRIFQGKRTDRKVLDRLKDDLLHDRHFQGETFNYKKDGTEYRVLWSISSIKNASGELIAYVSFQKDISNEYYYAKKLAMFQKVIDNSSMHIALLDQDMKFFYANNSFLQRTGYTNDEIIGANPTLLNSAHHDNVFYNKLYHDLEVNRNFKGVFTNKNSSGTFYDELQTIDAIYESDEIIGYSLMGSNYDDEIKKQKVLLKNSNKDALTGLLNRKCFDEMIVNFIDSYMKESVPFFMFFADLDNFKTVNDTAGHDMGDTVLKEVATLLTATLRKNDYIFRYGGDEFIWLLSDINYDKALEIKENIYEAFAQQETLKKYKIGISIGLSEYKGEDIKYFFKETDKQMYKVKLLHKTSG